MSRAWRRSTRRSSESCTRPPNRRRRLDEVCEKPTLRTSETLFLALCLLTLPCTTFTELPLALLPLPSRSPEFSDDSDDEFFDADDTQDIPEIQEPGFDFEESQSSAGPGVRGAAVGGLAGGAVSRSAAPNSAPPQLLLFPSPDSILALLHLTLLRQRTLLLRIPLVLLSHRPMPTRPSTMVLELSLPSLPSLSTTPLLLPRLLTLSILLSWVVSPDSCSPASLNDFLTVSSSTVSMSSPTRPTAIPRTLLRLPL